MGGPQKIFAKVRLTPGQLRGVAERRFRDAQCLLDSGDAERVNGAIYLAGFVVECLLKALLPERHPNLGKPLDPATLSPSDREVFQLLYSHGLDDMVEALPEIDAKLTGRRTASGASVPDSFRDVCEEWTVYARYSTATATRSEGKEFLETVDEVRKRSKEL